MKAGIEITCNIGLHRALSSSYMVWFAASSNTRETSRRWKLMACASAWKLTCFSRQTYSKQKRKACCMQTDSGRYRLHRCEKVGQITEQMDHQHGTYESITMSSKDRQRTQNCSIKLAVCARGGGAVQR